MEEFSKIKYNIDVTIPIRIPASNLNINYNIKGVLKDSEKKCVVNKYVNGFLNKLHTIKMTDINNINKDGSITQYITYTGEFLIINPDDIVLVKVVKVYAGIVRCELHNSAIKIIVESSTDYDGDNFELNKDDKLSYKKSGKEIKVDDYLIVKIKDVEIQNNNDYIYATAHILNIEKVV